MPGIIIFIILVAVVLIIVAIWRPSKFVGKTGEGFVGGRLNQLDSGSYKVLNDILLPFIGYFKNVQIDHIVVSNFGIFCLETKSFSGRIFGRATDKYWTQSLGLRSYRFYNPLRQNHAHLKALEALISSLQISAPVFSLVVFPNAEELKITGTNLAGHTGEIIDKIKSHHKQIISDEDRDIIYQAILENNIVDEKVRKEHAKAVKCIKAAAQKYKQNREYGYKERGLKEKDYEDDNNLGADEENYDYFSEDYNGDG